MALADCKECRGTGWVVAEEDGSSSAKRCGCVDTAQSVELLERAQIPENYRNASFDIVYPQNNPIARKTLSDAIQPIKAYANNYPVRGGGRGRGRAGPRGGGGARRAGAGGRDGL